jgi:hypothetical protein
MLRVVGAAVDTPALDVWLDDDKLIESLQARDVVPGPREGFMKVPAGTNEIAFTRAGDDLEDTFFARRFTLEKNQRYTLYTEGSMSKGPYGLFGADLVREGRPCAEGTSCATIVHAATTLGDLDVFLYLSPEEGWARAHDWLVAGDRMREPLELVAGRTCGIGFAATHSAEPEFAFPFKAPEGSFTLFLTDAGPSFWLDTDPRAVTLQNLMMQYDARGSLAGAPIRDIVTIRDMIRVLQPDALDVAKRLPQLVPYRPGPLPPPEVKPLRPYEWQFEAEAPMEGRQPWVLPNWPQTTDAEVQPYDWGFEDYPYRWLPEVERPAPFRLLIVGDKIADVVEPIELGPRLRQRPEDVFGLPGSDYPDAVPVPTLPPPDL